MGRAAASTFILVAALLATSGAKLVSANPVLLFEPESGRVLHAEEADRAWHPASVTKLMTAYLTFEAVKSGAVAWDAEVPLSDHARAQPATRIGLRAGIKLNVEQAVRGLVLRSANDFATALAERIGGTEEKFVESMNATAMRLGMTRTVFRNPHGLPDPEQVTTARDLAVLTMALLKDFPDRAEVFSTPTVRIHKGTFHSQNDLLRTLFGADGMKTGFTCASGYNVVASATRDGHRLIAIVLGAVSRQKRSTRASELIEAGFAYLGVDTPAEQSVHDAAHVSAPASLATAPAAHMHAHAAHAPPPVTITPVALADLAVAPEEALAPAEDIARHLRSGKCRGYGGFAKKENEPAVGDADAENDDAHVATVPAAASVAAPVTALVPAASGATNAIVAGKKAAPVGNAAPRKAAVRRSGPRALVGHDAASPVSKPRAPKTEADRPQPSQGYGN